MTATLTPATPRRRPTGSGPTRSRLGEILVAGGAVTESQLAHALDQQKVMKLPLGKVLLKLNYISDETMRQALSVQLNVPYVDLEKMTIDRSLARVINRGYAKRHSLLPIALIGRTLTVAMDDPTSTSVIDELTRLTGDRITVVTASSEAIERAFLALYDDAQDTPEPVTATTSSPDSVTAPPAATVGDERSGRADEMFQTLLSKALEYRTSDIHLEMLPTGLQVRFRVDGVLRRPALEHLQTALNRSMREVVSRVKILSRLDISERRRPQDGSFQLTVERDGRKMNIDLRVSIIPSYSGESVVIRILDRGRAPRSLAQLDLSVAVASRLHGILQHTTGIFIVTGPTGSGKSTTLYSCLMHLHRPEVRVLTAEDPVEFVYDELSQSEVNDDIGNTFAKYLRAFLRHDPEVIMVGEIRDQETAEMAFRSAQTGHLLLTTMHTNTAISALARLRDLNVESSLISSSLIGVMSQRLVRKICPSCREEFVPSAEDARDLFARVPAGLTVCRGRGCGECLQTGYQGRMLIADLWTPDEIDMRLITRQAPFGDVQTSALRTTLSMARDAHNRLVGGQTTIDELLRVLPYGSVAEHRVNAAEWFEGRS